MVNFVQKIQNFGATRVYTAPITSMETFQNAVTGILGTASLGTTERGSESYSIPVEIYDAAGEIAATINIRAETQSIYEATLSAATASSFAAAIAGTDA
ncbi:MAG: hypothetical protein Q4Q04_06150, partial [Methanocorpusculum sp.]|nr:hypothetical protein [Methanocorpusculum sp.]